MKKIFTLFFAATLISAVAFAQDGRHQHNNNSYDNSYQQQYPSDNGYANANPYNNAWTQQPYRDNNDYNSGRRGWDDNYHQRGWRRHHSRMIYNNRHWNDNGYYNNYGRNRNGLSFRIIIGSHRSGYYSGY